MQPNDPINPDNKTNTQNPISPGDTISPQPQVDNIQVSNETASIPVNTPSNTEAAPSQTSVNSDANISANIDANITTQPVQQDTTAPSQSYAAPMPNAQQSPNLTIVNNVPKQKKSTVAAIIIILLLILLAGGGAAAYFILGKNTGTQSTANTQTEQSNKKDETEATVNTNSKIIAFSYPLKIDGWSSELIDNQGITKYMSEDKACQITFSQNKGAANEEPQAQTSVDDYIAQVQQGLTSKIETTSADNITISNRTFIGKKIQYTGNDKTNYIVTVHAYTAGQYQLLIVKACSSNQWDAKQTSFEQLLSKVSIVET